jgi:hypothetical protein
MPRIALRGLEYQKHSDVQQNNEKDDSRIADVQQVHGLSPRHYLATSAEGTTAGAIR